MHEATATAVRRNPVGRVSRYGRLLAVTISKASAVVLAGLAVACGPKYDLVIRNGDVIDGTGAPARRADVAVTGDRIVAIGRVSGRGRLEVDAAGRAVTPGFIDPQGQSGVTLLVDGNGESHIRQGITTEITGEGSTPGLWTKEHHDEVAVRQYGIAFDWTGFDGWLKTLERKGSSINVGSFAPVAMLREQTVGMEERRQRPPRWRRKSSCLTAR